MPTDFAVAGLAGAVAGLFSILTAHGFGLALVQRKVLNEVTIHSVFWFLVLFGLCLGMLTALAAPVASKLYNQSAIIPAILFIAFSITIGVIGSVPGALLQRAMHFREINLITIIAGATAAIIGISLALGGYGYWALIIPPVVANIAKTICNFWFSGYRPKISFQLNEIKSLSKFGFTVIAGNLLYYINTNADYLIMGRFWTASAFGLYYFAFNKSRLILILIGKQIAGTILPALSQIQDDLPRLRKLFLKGTSMICLINFPIHVLVIGLANPLIPWIFGNQWSQAIPVFQVFSAFGFISAPSTLVNDTLLALNLPHIGLYYNIARVVIVLPILLILGLKGAGILTTAIILLIIWCIQLPIYIGYVMRRIKLSFISMLYCLKSTIFATIVMAIILIGSRMGVEALGLNLLTEVVISIFLSSTAFVLLMWGSLKKMYMIVRNAL